MASGFKPLVGQKITRSSSRRDVETATNALWAPPTDPGSALHGFVRGRIGGGETADKVADALSKKVSGLNIGPGMNNLDMGPLNSSPQRDRIVDLIQEGMDQGATILVDGRRHESYQHLVLSRWNAL
ncbi:MAG: hypothetical protein Ct9H300mP8_13320 [Gammaproteobacteria bacterium]|nr:MAG: hypothetical protein Ct9H300mP8_13320 [Gammaproteobacteria bacterium]